MQIEFSIYGEKQVDRELLRHAEVALDATPAFKAVAEKMQEDIKKNFESEGATMAGGWAALKPSTIAFKQAKGIDKGILQETGALMRSLTEEGEGMNLEIDPSGLKMESEVPYGIFHQKGTKNMVQRRVVDFTTVQRREYSKIIQRFLVEGAV